MRGVGGMVGVDRGGMGGRGVGGLSPCSFGAAKHLRVHKPLRKTEPKHHHLLHAPPVCSAPMKDVEIGSNAPS